MIISFQCILRSNISFVNHTFVYVLMGGEGAGAGLGPGQKFKNEFSEPTHCLCGCNDCQLYQMGHSLCQGALDPCMSIDISK